MEAFLDLTPEVLTSMWFSKMSIETIISVQELERWLSKNIKP